MNWTKQEENSSKVLHLKVDKEVRSAEWKLATEKDHSGHKVHGRCLLQQPSF